MSENKYLVIGGAGEAGQSAIEYFRKNDKNCLIISTTSENSNISGADVILTHIKANEDIVENIQSQLEDKLLSGIFHTIVYTPALGEVGYPIRQTTKDALEVALGISYYPMLELEKFYTPKFTIAYSAFYWLSHTLAFYGSMGFVKLRMDEWALASPTNRRIIRAGTFYSKSVRGISIVLQRTMKTTTDPDLIKLKTAFNESGKKFQDFFLDYAWKHEKEYFSNPGFKQAYRPTNREDLTRGLGNAMNTDAPITTVLGDWEWNENKLPDLPEWFK
ncbi:MAG: hypothetical protein SH817_07950 [Leptospira sp.]|nr:hypothetical protein [Leptospira sp.]